MRLSLLLLTMLRSGAIVSAPTAPTIVVALTSATNARITITDIDPTATELRVYRSTDNVSYSLLATIATNASPYDDATITSGTTTYYKVATANTGGETLSAAAATNTILYGLIEFVPFDEPSGNAVGVISGKVFTNNGGASYAAGQNGNAGVIAAGKYWSRTSEADLQTGNISFTVACKVYITSSPGAAAILAKGSAATLSTIEWAITHTGPRVFTFDVWQSGTTQSLSATDFGTFALNTWYSIVAWVDVDANTINISVNGTVTSATKTKTPVAGNAPLGIGAYGNGAANIIGRIEDVQPIAKRVWSAGERAAFHSKTYPFDTTGMIIDATVNARSARYIVPVAPRNNVLVMYHHGSGETHTAWQADALKKAIREALLADGYLLCGISAHGNNWGNAAAEADYEALYADALSRYPTLTKVVILAQSMGGLSGLNAVSGGEIPVAGWYGIYPACDLAALFGLNAGAFAAEIRNAYGIAADGSDYAAKTAGQDPILRAAALYDIPMRFTASAADTTIPKTSHSDAMSAYVAAYAPEETIVVCSGQHGDPSHFNAADVLAFFERC